MARARRWHNFVIFRCPGCKHTHSVRVKRGEYGPSWSFNGSLDRPTFHPSIQLKSGCYAKHYKKGDACWCTYNAEHPDDPDNFACGICHSHVTDGKIRFLTDCTHALSGQTVELPELDDPDDPQPRKDSDDG